VSDALILARKFRAALLQRDAAAQAEVLRAYEKIWVRLSEEIERTVEQIQSAGSSPSLAFEQRRLQELQDQLAIEIDRLVSSTASLTIKNQSAVVSAARLQAAQLMRAAARDSDLRASFASLAKEELTHLIGIAQDGSPMKGVFRQLARSFKLESADVITEELLAGVAQGKNPRAIARSIRQTVDDQQSGQDDPRLVRRLNTTVRQEVLGAYREATRLSYEENQHLLGGWVWTSTRSATTCVICWAMDGKVFPAAERMVSHVNCRCVMRPLLPGESPGVAGTEAFPKLERGVQKDILGESAFSAYESRMLDLPDFVGIRSDLRWGDSRYRRSLEDILGRATARKLRSLPK
jgi:SPP1 gp7 family putative phage head morphogenesis protein